MRHHIIGLAAALLVGACSGPADESGTLADGSEGPAISPTAAPGVTFRFSYDYSLDDERIASVQEGHAAACEQLGLVRCRITGMTYRIDDQERVAAMLQVKLHPGIARQFGKRATGLVEQNDGNLVSAEFQGDDVGTQIESTQSQQSAVETRIADLERRLAAMPTGDRERSELQRQLDGLRERRDESAQEIASGKAQLAVTPMTFNYYGEGGIAGFDQNPFKESWRLMVESAVTMISFLLKAIGVLLPWLALGLLLALLWRSRLARHLRGWWNRATEEEAEQA